MEQETGSFPQALDVDWNEVRRAVEVGGLTPKEAAESFKISWDSVRQRVSRENWLTPARMAERIRQKEQEAQEAALSQIVTARAQNGDKTSESPHLPVTASSARLSTFLDYKDRTMLKLAKVADRGLEQVVNADLPIENWQDAKIVADIAMKLHNVGQEGVQVNIAQAFAGMDEGPVISISGDESDEDESTNENVLYFVEDE